MFSFLPLLRLFSIPFAGGYLMAAQRESNADGSTELVENRLPFDVVFILNRFFEAVGSAITAAGGTPNQFIGDGVMAIFGAETGAGAGLRRKPWRRRA